MADLDEIFHFCLSTIRPMGDVVFDTTGARTAGKPTTMISSWSARRMAGGMLRVLRPTFSAEPSSSSCQWTTPQSQASLLDVSAQMRAPDSSSASAVSPSAASDGEGRGLQVDGAPVASGNDRRLPEKCIEGPCVPGIGPASGDRLSLAGSSYGGRQTFQRERFLIQNHSHRRLTSIARATRSPCSGVRRARNT